jgi:hypothetical protein
VTPFIAAWWGSSGRGWGGERKPRGDREEWGVRCSFRRH